MEEMEQDAGIVSTPSPLMIVVWVTLLSHLISRHPGNPGNTVLASTC